jgi:branched-chain amino acid transport system substrate-binding protein
MKRLMIALAAVGLWAAAPPHEAAAQQQQQCPVRLGGVLSLTGSMGPTGRGIADTAQMAVEHLNAAGGVQGCQIEFLLRDDQNQPSVGVDAAKNLVDVSQVPAIIGSISSGVTMPILTSVTVPGHVTLVSCCSTAPNFTQLAQAGQTQGYWFRTLPTGIVQAATAAKIATDRGWRKTVVLYVNTDFGVNQARDFQRIVQRMGGSAVAIIPFNENQPSYRAEVTQALATDNDSMFLVGFPQDSATLMREWLSNGGTQNLVLNNALRNDEFVRNVGARFLNRSCGFDNAQVEGPSVDAFNAAFQQRFNHPPNGPGLHTVYDAVVVTALAMQAGPAPVTGTTIRDNIRRVTGGDGTVVIPGVEGLRAGLNLLRQGQRIRYVGATGPIEFDANGDVGGPALIWCVRDGQLVRDSVITLEQMTELLRRVAQ